MSAGIQERATSTGNFRTERHGQRQGRDLARVEEVVGKTHDPGSPGADFAEPAAAFKQRLEALRQAAEWPQLPFSLRLRRIRKARVWSHPQLAGRMVLVAKSHGGSANPQSLKTSLSRWENGSRVADERNRRMLAEALSVDIADLGLTEDPDFDW